MPSTLITPVADALQTLLDGLGVTPAVKAYRWAPRAMSGTGPFAVVELPAFERRDADDAEQMLGFDDWHLEFPVTLYVDLSDPDVAQNRLVDLVEAFIAAVDDDHTLGVSLVNEAVVTGGEPFLDLTDEARPLIAYACDVHVWRRRAT